jgi:hypothetical protein
MSGGVSVILLLAVPMQVGHDPGSQGAARRKHERVLAIYAHDATEYTIYRDATRNEEAKLRRKPVLDCSDPARGNGDGAVFVWTCRGRPEAIGMIYSFPMTGPRALNHEFHSLSLSVLDVTRAGTHSATWRPLAPGIELAPIAGAPRPAESPPLRLSQMRAISREFSASTTDHASKRLELRLLPQPIYRYESTDPDVIDGALFVLVTSTDPEALVVIEERKPPGSDRPIWEYAVCRMTDLGLIVRHKGKNVYDAPLIPYGSAEQDPKHRFRVFHDRDIPAIEEAGTP